MAQLKPDDGDRQIESDNIKPPPPYREGRRQFITGDTGRQGPSGFRVLVVLSASLLLTMIVWALVSGFSF
jgi:hypothetical protein